MPRIATWRWKSAISQPDYIFFGKIGGDIKPEAHPKNLALAEWWASMVEVPCIVMGGTDPQSALAVAETGAEFVALCQAVFAEPAQRRPGRRRGQCAA